jgi:type IV secretory pathway TrbF-like protein
MFRQNASPAPVEDIVTAGRRDWNDQVARAVGNQTAWKSIAFAALGGLMLFAGDDVRRAAAVAPPQVVHVVHDNIGDIIGLNASTDSPAMPSQIMLKAAMEQWIIYARSVYIDVPAMRRAQKAAAYLISRGSQADQDYLRFYQSMGKEGPFTRAQTETVAPSHVVAVPPTQAEIGRDNQQTWQVSWTETVTSRDGSAQTSKSWAANVTFTVTPPKTVADADRDPDGIHIVAYAWTEK